MPQRFQAVGRKKIKEEQLSSPPSKQKTFQNAFDWAFIIQQDAESWKIILNFIQG